MPLLLVQAFVNTWDGEVPASDVLLQPTAAGQWLAAAGLWTGTQDPEPAELHAARDVREGIRAMLIANRGGPKPRRAELQPLRALAWQSRPQLDVGQDGQVSVAPGLGAPLTSQLTKLLLMIRDAQRDGTWPRLKACSNFECRWAFYDRSHGRVGVWCSMASCGNRIKNRRMRERQR